MVLEFAQKRSADFRTDPDMAKKEKMMCRDWWFRKVPRYGQIYAQYRREFSAADLQKYTVDEPTVP